jgi:hypothetical protein
MWEVCKIPQNTKATFAEKVYKKHIRGSALAKTAPVRKLRKLIKSRSEDNSGKGKTK